MTYLPTNKYDGIQVIDARDYGAIGDGSADDSAALVAWSLACSVGTISTPVIARARGDFRFSSELTFAPSGASGTIHFDLDGASFTWTAGNGSIATESFTFDNAARTITRASGSFIDDGFTANRWIDVNGSTNNDERFWVTNVTASTLTVDVDLFAASPLTDETVTCTIRDRLVMFRIGDGQSGNKWFYSSLRGLYLTQTTNFSDVTGLEIDHSDFMEISNCTLSIGGGAASGSRCLDVSGFSKQGFGSVNSLTVTSMNTVGADEGIFIDQSNVFSLRGGKIQQHTTGFTARNAAVIQLSTLDFSLNSQNALFFDSTGAVDLHNVYAEQNGPGTRGNDAKLYYFKDCRGINISGCNINGTNGATNDATHPGYGIYFEGTDGAFITGSTSKLCQRAIVYCDANCRDIVIDSSFVVEHGAGYNHNTLQPITDESGKLVNNAKGRALSQLPPLNNLLTSGDIRDASWTTVSGANISGTVSSEDTGSQVAVLELPNVQPTLSSIESTSATTSGALGSTLYLRVKIKLVNFRESVVANRDTDFAVIRLSIQGQGSGGSSTSGLLRLGETWDWYELQHTPLSDDQFKVVIEVRQSQEPIDIAVEDVQLVLARGEYSTLVPDSVDNLFSWYRADLGVEEAAADSAEDSDPVQYWRDQGPDGYDLEQSVLASRPLFTASSTSMNNHSELTFDDTDDDLASDEASSIWNFLHDGSGCTIIMAVRPTAAHIILDTADSSPNNHGISIDWISPDDVRVRIANGSGSYISNLTTTTNVAPSTGAVLTVRHGTSHSPNNVEVRSGGATILTDDYGDTPSASDASATLHVGNRQGGSLAFGGGILEVIFYDRVLSDTELQNVESYALNRYGFI